MHQQPFPEVLDQPNLTRRMLAILASVALVAVAVWMVGPEELMGTFLLFPLWVFATILGLFVLNLLIVSYRLGIILNHFGIRLPSNVISKASVSGHVAGLFVISIFGHVIGRHLVLNRFDVPSVLIASLTAYERIALIVVSGSLCIAGTIVLIGQTDFVNLLRKLSLLEIFLVAGFGLILTFCIGRSSIETRLISKLRSWKSLGAAVETFGITLLAQALVLTTFLVGISALNPNLDTLDIVAASAIICFAASMPVTINGWGVREIVAVYILGQLGISPSSALAVSILIGLCSTAVIILAMPIAFMKLKTKNTVVQNSDQHENFIASSYDKDEIEKIAAFIIATAAAVLIWFQVHAELPNGILNLNLADPFAILALAAMVIHVAVSRQAPVWKVSRFNIALVSISALIVFAFLRGALEIGITQWAFAGRLIGWLVLLGYLSIGYMLVNYNGSHIIRRFCETFVSIAVVIILFQCIMRFLVHAGYIDWPFIQTNFEGFSGNRNAFVFQLLSSLVMVLVYSPVYARNDRYQLHKTGGADGKRPGFFQQCRDLFGPQRTLFALLTGVILMGIVLAGSRAGLITCGAVIVFAWVWRLADRRMIEMSIFFSLLLERLPLAFFHITKMLQNLGPHKDAPVLKYTPIGTGFSGGTSQVERWESIFKGLELWWNAPFLGTGLGVFIEKSEAWMGKTTVIHSTPIWILSELGIVGLVIFLWVFFMVLQFSLGKDKNTQASRIVILLLIVFSLFSLVHEILYQRISWLILGATLAGALSSGSARAASHKLVCHIITGLNAGGAERMLTRLISARGQGKVRHMVVSMMDEGVFGRDIRAQGVQLHALGMHRGSPSFAGLLKLVHLLRKHNPDVLITWLYHADLIGFIAGTWVGVRKKFWNLRCSNMTNDNRSILSRMMMWALICLSPCLNKVIVNSKAGQRHHMALGYRPRGWKIIPNGVDLNQFQPAPSARSQLRDEIGAPEDALLIGHVARCHPMKDYTTLLDALEKVAEHNPSSHFVLVGKDVNLSNPFFAEKNNQQVFGGRIHLLDSRNDIPKIMAGLDILVQSSAYGEGSPNSVIEAMACSVPCVVTDVGDTAVIVDNTGWVVAPSDVDGLAEALLDGLRLTDVERQELGKAARKRIEEHYNIDAVVAQYHALILHEG